MKIIKIYILLLFTFLFVSNLNADIYHWLDKNGIKHYSNKKPPSDAKNVEHTRDYKSKQNTELSPTPSIKIDKTIKAKAKRNYDNKSESRVVPLPGSGYAHSIDGTSVACTAEYNLYEHSIDGSSVCAGGKYNLYEHSIDGGDVACGGEYNLYEHSIDGSSVCAGGKYNLYEHSIDGGDVACGGEYNGWQDSLDGKKVCAGGKFNGCVHSKDGSHVACGGWNR